ncbi:MAG: hypothetical protein K2J80_09160, partial [Oscillospiraceae bacterium]|nr:hypothetical protein [Oscillospiraceae bacterium]
SGSNSGSISGTGTSGTTSNTNSGTNSGTTSKPEDNDSAPATDVKDDDAKLSILAWSSNEDVPLLIDFFCEKTGFDKNNIEWVKLGDSGGKAREQYRNYLKGDGDADLIFCDADWIQEYANDELTIPLSELGIAKSDYKGKAYDYTLAVGTNNDGQFTGVSWQATPGCFVYNAKKAKELLGVETPAQMQEKVKDWDTFKATAKEVAEKSEGKTVLQCTEGGLWQVRQAALSKPWVVDNKFQMDSVAEDFYDMAKEFVDNKYLDPNIDQWSTAWYNAINDGSAIGDFVPTWGLKGASGSIIYNFAAGGSSDEDGNFVANDSAATDLLSACEGPQGWFWGGTFMCATNKCNTKKSAADFIKLFTQNEEAMKEYATKNGDFMNSPTVMAGVKFDNPVLIGGQNQFEILLDKAKTIDLDGKISQYDAQIKEQFNNSVKDYIKGNIASKDEAIVEAKKNIGKEISAITVE